MVWREFQWFSTNVISHPRKHLARSGDSFDCDILGLDGGREGDDTGILWAKARYTASHSTAHSILKERIIQPQNASSVKVEKPIRYFPLILTRTCVSVINEVLFTKDFSFTWNKVISARTANFDSQGLPCNCSGPAFWAKLSKLSASVIHSSFASPLYLWHLPVNYLS